jgi:hypothetical protein
MQVFSVGGPSGRFPVACVESEGDHPSVVPLYVFKIGNSYAAMDRSTPRQPAYWVIFFTPLWAFTTILRMW